MRPIISISNLSVAFLDSFLGQKKFSVQAVEAVSFDLEEGKITAIVGQSGSGKSTVALAVTKLLARNAKVSGDIIFKNQNLADFDEKALCKIRGKDIGMIFQDPTSSLNPLHTIKKQITEAITIHNKAGSSSKKIDQRISELLQLVGLKDFSGRLNSYPYELSGGQKQRVMIAIAIANNPKILIADEPTTALDISTEDKILKLLLDLRKKLNLTILFITHNLRVVKKLADVILVMHNGKIVERGSNSAIFSNPQNNYTKLLISALKSSYKTRRNQSGVRNKNLDILKKQTILQVSNLRVKFAIKRNFFGIANKHLYANDNITFSLNRGQNLGIIGESGSGKSTLALAVTHLIKSEGEIIFNGQNIRDLSPKERKQLRKKIQIIFQDPYGSLNPRMTVADIIAEGLTVHHPQMSKRDKDKAVDDILVEVGLNPDIKERYPHQFSGGQRQRIAIARSLILKPELLILDEPTAALDVVTQNEILKLLDKLQQNNLISYIFISHDLDVIKAASDQIMVIKDGKLVELLKNKEAIKNPQNNYSKELISYFA